MCVILTIIILWGKGRADCISFDIAQVYSRTYFEATLHRYKYYSRAAILGIKLVRITKIIISSIWDLGVLLTRFYQFFQIPRTTYTTYRLIKRSQDFNKVPHKCTINNHME